MARNSETVPAVAEEKPPSTSKHSKEKKPLFQEIVLVVINGNNVVETWNRKPRDIVQNPMWGTVLGDTEMNEI